MSSFAEKLAAAKAARPTKDVQVILDGRIAAERERLEAELATADTEGRLGGQSDAEKVQEQIDGLVESAADSLVTLRFTRLPGKEWAQLTSLHPIRLNVPIDRHYGYNYDAVCEAAAAASGVRVETEKDLPSVGSGIAIGWSAITDKDHILVPVTAEEWAELFDVLAGSDVESIRDAVWELNEFDPEQRRQALVKGSGAATRSVTK